MMKCKSYVNDECRYVKALQGTDEEIPSGCSLDGNCIVDIPDFGGQWFMVDPEDCDMLDLQYEEENEGDG